MKFGIAVNLLLLGLGLAVAVNAQTKLTPNSARLEKLRLSIEKRANVKEVREYLARFPKTCQSFTRTFNAPKFDELYTTYEEHLLLLSKLFDREPKTVRSIWFGVAIDCNWDADAVATLQHQLADYGARYTKTFASELISMTQKKRLSIIRFLADVENHKAYSEYISIQKNLKMLHSIDLEREFAAAKAKRIKEKDHGF